MTFTNTVLLACAIAAIAWQRSGFAVCTSYGSRAEMMGSKSSHDNATNCAYSISMPMKSTSNSLVRTYQKEVERQRLLVRKAEFTQQRLLFITGALRELFADESFTNLMRAEGLDTLPKYLAERITLERAVA